MARQCAICVDERRLEVDRLLIQNHGTYTWIAEQYGFTQNQVRNHAIHHLSRQLATTYSRRELIMNTEMVDELKGVLEKAKDIFQRNYEVNKDATALRALDSVRSTLELICRIGFYIYEAKRAEEEAGQLSEERKLEQEHDEFMEKAMARLNYSELDMLEKLLNKAAGRTEETIIEDDVSPFVNINYNLENEEYGRDPSEPAPEPARTWIDYDRDFGDMPPRPTQQMRRTK